MVKPEDWRESRIDTEDSGLPDDGFAPRTDLSPDVAPRRSAWQRLRQWLFNIIPVVLSLASAWLMLYLLAKLTGLG